MSHQETPSPEQTLVVLDTETTGLDHRTEQIIELAAVKISGGEVVETFNTLVNPQIPIRYSSFLIHGISDDEVQSAPTMAEVLPGFLDFMGDAPYAAHNAIFDYSFINQACKTLLDKRFKNHRIDTLDMYRSVFPDEPSHGLSALLGRFGYDTHVKHRALDDALALAKVYAPLRDLYVQKHRWQFSQLDNVEYLVERYLRLQKAMQTLQAEMSDLKDIFKLYFREGGKPIEATTGELMVSSFKRSYEYDEEVVWEVLTEAGLIEKAYKLNPKFLDRLLEHNTHLTDDQKNRLKDTRLNVYEARMVTFVKPTLSSNEEESVLNTPPSTEQGFTAPMT